MSGKEWCGAEGWEHRKRVGLFYRRLTVYDSSACGSLILHDLHVLHGFFSTSPSLHGLKIRPENLCHSAPLLLCVKKRTRLCGGFGQYHGTRPHDTDLTFTLYGAGLIASGGFSIPAGSCPSAP